jgi:hypothetical protein
MTKTVLTLACAGALLFALAGAHAAQQGIAQSTPPEPKAEAGTTPNATGGEGAKPEEGAPAQEETPQPQNEDGPKSLGELTQDGFEILTTEFVPADAVTRQSGKVSSDAILVTLRKTGTTAICFYTLKAYVGKKLNAIPACIVHR